MEKLRKFLISMKVGTRYYVKVILVDPENKDRSEKFIFDSIKNTFPNRESINNMISKIRQQGDTELMSVDNFQEVEKILSERIDLEFLCVYHNENWFLINRV